MRKKSRNSSGEWTIGTSTLVSSGNGGERLYSIGPDGIDHGGRRQTDEGNQTDDFFARLP